MAENYKCPHCEAEFKSAQGLANHIKFKHPEAAATRPLEERGVPDAANDFELLLKDYGVKRASIIAKNITATGSPNVFNDPAEMAKGLAKWPRDIDPVHRQNILEHWFKSRGIVLPKELIEEVGMQEEDKKAKAKKQEAEKKVAEGAVWTVDVDESGVPRIRMIKAETEPGVTLAEAKAAAKEIGKEREEPIVVYNEGLGRHMPNFKAPFVKQNPIAAWATAKQMDRAIAEGEPADPMDVWIEQQAKTAQFKEVMGLTPEPKEKTPVSEIVSALKDLKAMADEGGATSLPDWVSDPVKFLETVRGVSGAGEGKGLPEWMTDPVKFIETIRTISTEGKGGDAVTTELAALKKALETMQQERRDEQLLTLQGHIKQLTETVEQLKKPVTGKTEMDILHEVATEGISLAKTELSGLRSDIKEALGSTVLPGPKSKGEREETKTKLREAVKTDKEMEEIGQRLFFAQS